MTGQNVKPETSWWHDPDTLRAFAIDRYRSKVKEYRDGEGKPLSTHEQTLILIGYTTGWDDQVSGRAREEAAACDRLLTAIEGAGPSEPTP
jgi:hypothetical protein